MKAGGEGRHGTHGWTERKKPGAMRSVLGRLALSLATLPMLAHAAGTGTAIYGSSTLPSGIVKVGADYWVSDHALGFCRLVPGSNGAPGYVDQTNCAFGPVSTGQAASAPACDTAANYAFVPDNSTKGQGVWRFLIKDGAVFESILLPNAGINGNRPMAVTLGPDGHLYVSLGRNNSIMRITNPTPSCDSTVKTSVTEKMGTSAVKVGPPALAFIGKDLYLAENTGVTMIANAAGLDVQGRQVCSSSVQCAAKAVNTGVGAPVFITSDGPIAFIADLNNVYRYTPPLSGQPACLKLVGSGYGNVASLAMNTTDPAVPGLFVGDDPTAGASFFKGVIYNVDPNPANVNCAPTGAPVGGGGGTGAPPVAASGAVLATPPATGLTLPNGVVQIGSETWVSDHLQGFCKIFNGTLANCVTGGPLAPGQAVAVPAVDRAGTPLTSASGAPITYIYVPDTASKGLGVWRLTHDGNGTVGAPFNLVRGQLNGSRATAVAYGPDRRLYVVSGKDANVQRISGPDVDPTSTETQTTLSKVGAVAGRGGPPSIAFRGEDLYFAEATGVTSLVNARACTGSCLARAAAIAVAAPVFITSDNVYLYIADVSKAYRYKPAVTSGPNMSPSAQIDLGSGFANISGLGLFVQPNISGGSTTSLFVGDDTSAGVLNGQGRVWKLDLSGVLP
jgi:hypothetical protein